VSLNNINSNVCAAHKETEFHSAVLGGRGAVGVLCVVQDIIEMEQLWYYAQYRILLKWSSFSAVHSAGYY